jgi:hypothetical protein
MKDLKHTQGEWKVVEFPDKSDCFVQAPKTNPSDPYEIEIMQDGHDGLYSYEQKMADAKLIAAAPELLEALTSMLNVFNRHLSEGQHGYSQCKKGIKAIKKATE